MQAVVAAMRPPAKSKRRRQNNAGGAHAVLPSLPQVKITSGKTGWSNTAGARILADFTIPQQAKKMGYRKSTHHRSNSAISNRSRLSARSMDSATERSFRPARNKAGGTSMASAR